MTAWKAKRFWKTATSAACEGGYTILLDSRVVKTPGKQTLVVPTYDLAQAIAHEWDAQVGLIKPDQMPMTRYANSAMEKVTPQFDEVTRYLAAYGETDLLCYRAIGPEDLVLRQELAWDPLLDWCKQSLGASLIATAGVMYIQQPQISLLHLLDHVQDLTPFQISAFHDLVAISGSLVLAFAVAEGHIGPAEAFQTSRIDEHWQAEQWGQDEEALELEASKQKALLEAHRFFALCG
jgi:chaperone required for assembly of F1-ATPase